MRLPDDKLERMQKTVNSYKAREWATKKELDQLAGLLAHCSTVLRDGQTFSHRIYDLCATEKRSYAKIGLDEEFKKDIDWWSFSRPSMGREKSYQRNPGPLACTVTPPSGATQPTMEGTGLQALGINLHPLGGSYPHYLSIPDPATVHLCCNYS